MTSHPLYRNGMDYLYLQENTMDVDKAAPKVVKPKGPSVKEFKELNQKVDNLVTMTNELCNFNIDQAERLGRLQDEIDERIEGITRF